MKRFVYNVNLVFNELKINEVIIDQHYKKNHSEIDDELILRLVFKLNNLVLKPKSERGNYKYFIEEPVYLDSKPYRLIFTIENGWSYLGVINAFRVREKKYGISF